MIWTRSAVSGVAQCPAGPDMSPCPALPSPLPQGEASAVCAQTWSCPPGVLSPSQSKCHCGEPAPRPSGPSHLLVCSLAYCPPRWPGSCRGQGLARLCALCQRRTGLGAQLLRRRPVRPACRVRPLLGTLPALKQAQRVAGAAVVTGGLQSLTRRADRQETLLRRRGWQWRGQRQSKAELTRLEKSPQGVLTLTSAPPPGRGGAHAAGGKDQHSVGRCTPRARIIRWPRAEG